MTFEDYQSDASYYACYNSILYPFMALAEEAGEVAGKVAKHLRKHGTTETEMSLINDADLCAAVKNELGDVLWQLAACASELGISLEHIATENLAKLADRATRGVIVGEGDNR